MCNAWNHPPDCDCGWGGDTGGSARVYHLGTRPRQDHKYLAAWSFKRPGVTEESYTRPNARCPVCGDCVFFYQSPNGGRVFFDELGGDWPKHPCTDNYSPSASFRSTVPTISPGRGTELEPFDYPEVVVGAPPMHPPRWLGDGWQPLLSPHWGQWPPSPLQPTVSRLIGRLGAQGKTFTVAVLIGTALDLHAPIFVKRHAQNFNWWWIDEPRLIQPTLACEISRVFNDDLVAELAISQRHGPTLCSIASGRLGVVPTHSPRRDLRRVRAWYLMAARAGDPTGFTGLAQLLESDGSERGRRRAAMFSRYAAKVASREVPHVAAMHLSSQRPS